MKTRKQKLIEALSLAIHALENNTIHYEWTHQESCNCGIVAQAVLGVNNVQLRDMWQGALSVMNKHKRDEEKIDPTWQNAVKRLCPITGEPMADVFRKLFNAGLTKEDIVHLEYMNNVAILKRSGIDTSQKYYESRTKKVKRTETTRVPHWFFLFRWLGGTVAKIEETITNQSNKVEVGYHTTKENLILYLKGWVAILKEGGKYTTGDSVAGLSKVDLEQELINAVAEENYDYAVVLRDEINQKHK